MSRSSSGITGAEPLYFKMSASLLTPTTRMSPVARAWRSALLRSEIEWPCYSRSTFPQSYRQVSHQSGWGSAPFLTNNMDNPQRSETAVRGGQGRKSLRPSLYTKGMVGSHTHKNSNSDGRMRTPPVPEVHHVEAAVDVHAHGLLGPAIRRGGGRTIST